MLSFLVRRLLAAIPTLLLVSVFVFTLLKLLPGDPALALAGDSPDPQALAFIRAKYGLDQSLPVQYFTWLGNLLTGDWGLSIRTGLPISEMLIEKLPVTLQLAFQAILLALIIGIPAGVFAAAHRGTPADYLVSLLGLGGLSIPAFWFGIMLILLFAVVLGWFPSGGYVSFFQDPIANLHHTFLPSLVLGTAAAAIVMRHTRSSMIAVLEQDFIRTARSKGVSERRVVIRHGLRNALVPVVTTVTLHLGELLSGAVLTEQVFGIPGFGKMIVDGVFSRDYAVVQAVVLCAAAMFLLMSLLADIAYAILNPKLRS